MSGALDFAASTGPLIDAILSALRSSEHVQAVFGSPARIYDARATGAAYPFAILERCESQAADSVAGRGFEHTFHFATFARHSGVEQSKALLSVLRAAFDQIELELSDQKIVLLLPTYSDVLHTKNQNVQRGILRVRIRTEAVAR